MMPDHPANRAVTKVTVAPGIPDQDGEAIAVLYNRYVETSTATFEERAVAASAMRQRMAAVGEAGLPWLKAQSAAGVLCGYAYATPWRARSAYRFAVESTVYVAADAQRLGIGRRLYLELFMRLCELGMRTVIAGVTLPNAPSVALHERMGMTQVAHFRRVGFKFDQWWDVGYWQVHLDDWQSQAAGTLVDSGGRVG